MEGLLRRGRGARPGRAAPAWPQPGHLTWPSRARPGLAWPGPTGPPADRPTGHALPSPPPPPPPCRRRLAVARAVLPSPAPAQPAQPAQPAAALLPCCPPACPAGRPGSPAALADGVGGCPGSGARRPQPSRSDDGRTRYYFWSLFRDDAAAALSFSPLLDAAVLSPRRKAVPPPPFPPPPSACCRDRAPSVAGAAAAQAAATSQTRPLPHPAASSLRRLSCGRRAVRGPRGGSAAGCAGSVPGARCLMSSSCTIRQPLRRRWGAGKASASLARRRVLRRAASVIWNAAAAFRGLFPMNHEPFPVAREYDP